MSQSKRIYRRLWIILGTLSVAACLVEASASPNSPPPHPATVNTNTNTNTNNNNNHNNRPPPSRPLVSIRLPGRPYEEDDDDDYYPSSTTSTTTTNPHRRFGRTRSGWQLGLGREFDFFDTRGGQNNVAEDDWPDDDHDDSTTSSSSRYGYAENDSSDDEPMAPWAMKAPSSPSSRSSARRPNLPGSGGAASTTASSSSALPGMGGASTATGGRGLFGTAKKHPPPTTSTVFQSAQEWWTSTITPTVKNWPRIQCRVEPTTTLKIRKTFRPLKTIVRLGADFNTQLGVWQFKSSWEDAIIGGKITLAGRELQLSKSWQLSVGAVEDLVTRLRFRAAVDLQTWKAYARVGFRTERLSPINIMEGFTLLKQLPLDGNRGNVKLEVKANFALPEPEIEYSTESHRSLVGMGDIEINIDELNLVLDY